MTDKEKIEEIIQGISSPYGEGASYKKCKGYKKKDGKLTHLDEDGAVELRKDIETLLKDREKRVLESFIEFACMKKFIDNEEDFNVIDTLKKEYLQSNNLEGKV